MSDQEVLRISGVRAAYGSLPVTEPLSFTVSEGEFVCVVGPSGCGKSTLLRVIAGFPPAFPPPAGEVLLRGRPVRGPGRDRTMVFQDHALFPWLNAAGNVALGLHGRGMSASERADRVAAQIESVGLTGFSRAYPHELSGGMKQRVGLARALVGEPTVLLMDEPFASVDALTRVSLQRELRRLWESQRPTIIFVTHNIDEALSLGTRVLVLSARPGRVLLDEAIADPASAAALRARVEENLGLALH